MRQLARWSIVMAMAGSAAGLALWPSRAQTPASLPTPAIGGTRGPSALAFSRDGRTLYLAEQDTGQVAILEPESGKLLARIPSGGKELTGIALSPDGRALAVCNSFSGSVGVIDLEKRALKATIPLPGGPYEVAFGPDGRAWVSVSRLDQVALVDVAGGKVAARIPVGRRPRALALAPDGRTLVCTNMAGGDVSLIDTATAKEVVRVPIGAVNLRGIAISPGGARAYVTGQQPHNDLPTERPEAMWSNVVCVLRLGGAQSRLEKTVALDTSRGTAADPYGVAFIGDLGAAFVALGGAHEVAWVTPDHPLAPPGPRVVCGANPRAVAVQPGTNALWVANHLGNSLTVVQPNTPPRTIELEPPPQTDSRLRGRYLFTSAHLTQGGRFTCNTCHPDGNTEGLAWKFAHVHDGLVRRNSRNLRGGLLLTGPFGWGAREDDFEDFVKSEILLLLHGPKLAHGDLHAFWEFVNDFDLPPNPYRNADGSFTAAAVRGKSLFDGTAGCKLCHGGPLYGGGTGKKEWVGTTPEGIKVDVPHLVGVYDSPPYLHDASAITLEAIFTQHNTGHNHGKAHLLTDEQLRDLIEYVREL